MAPVRSSADLVEASRFQYHEKYIPWDDFIDVFASLGRLLVQFGLPLDFEGGPQISFMGIEANKIRKNAVIDRVLKKHEFQWISDAKIRGPDLVKNEFGSWCVAI